jgi:hypothetical protein
MNGFWMGRHGILLGSLIVATLGINPAGHATAWRTKKTLQ